MCFIQDLSFRKRFLIILDSTHHPEVQCSADKSNRMAKMAFQHQAGTAMECLSIPITLHKEKDVDDEGREVLKCGFKIGGGIDQDFKKSPQGYTDYGIYVTEVHEGSPAAKSGLRMHDKILQCNGYDFTMVTHKKAVSYIRKNPVLNLLVARKGVTST